MPISFDSIPANARVPFVFVEIDSSRAGAGGVDFKSLLIGQRLSTGAVEPGIPTPIANAAAAGAAFGRGSLLHGMALAFRRQNPLGDPWAVALDDAVSSTKATITVTVGSAATAAGTIALYVAGRRIAIGIGAGDAVGDLPATATATAGVVTVTARHGGTASDIDVRVNHHPDEVLPPGVAIAITTGVVGATDPDLDDALAAIGDEQYNVIAVPYTATGEIAKLEAELAERWGPTQQIDGVGIAAYKGAGGTQAQVTTYGNARNSPHISVMDAGGSSTPTWAWAAAIAGAVSASATGDPARPFQTLPLNGVMPAAIGDRRTFAERNTLLFDGISTHTVDRGGTVRIERLVTTYQTTASGVPDTAFLDLNTPLTLSHLRADFRNTILRKYPRHKLADDGTRIGPGQAVVTPSVGRAEAIALFRRWEERGLVEGADQFKADLVVERDAQDRNRLNWLMAPDVINQFRVGGAKISFLL